jgi:NAD(P)-dependent dehydrogenase (short-subunit alcohol dehydrogenase family)
VPESLVVTGGATTLDANRQAVSAATERDGRLDILVNCVGVFDFYRPLDDIEEDRLLPAFDEMFRANVASQLLSVKAALPFLRGAKGSVVLTASTSSFHPGRGGVLYVASKFAVRGTVVALAHELAPDVRVNAVAPGGTLDTDLRGLDTFGEAGAVLAERPGREDELRARTPLAVALTPADHAAAYVFLASDAARGMTGTFLHSDGGIGVKG